MNEVVSGQARRAGVRGAIDSRVLLLAVVAISALYVSWYLDRCWYPADDGVIAHSAMRVLDGQLPHRDYDDVYTGGLAYLNAGAFRLFGTTYLSLRLVLMGFFVAWVPGVFWLASRFVRPFPAAAATLLAVVWSVPNYMAPMPSWYNLFLATFGVAALFRYLDERSWYWLFAAGLAGGLSVLVKVVGLYYIAGVLLFLVFQAQSDSSANAPPHARRSVGYATFVSASLLLFVAPLIVLVRRQLYAAEVVHFVLPGALIAALLARNEWRVRAGSDTTRFAALVRLIVPFIVGAGVPVVVFLVPYVTSGALPALVNGLFVLPLRRFDSASVPMLPLWTLLTLALPAGIIAVMESGARRGVLAVSFAFVAVTLTTLIVATGHYMLLYRLVWTSARAVLPVLLIAGVVVLARQPSEATSERSRSRAMLLLSVTAMCSLIQLPFSEALYYCYVAPLVILCALALLRYFPPRSATACIPLVAFYLAFAVLRINTAAPYGMGKFYLDASSVTFDPLAGGHGGVNTTRVLAREYQAITYLLATHARGGYTWASPDSPEIYFLTALRSPTRSFYEFFGDSTGNSARVLRALDEHGITAIVENTKPAMSAPIPADLTAALEARYPHAAEIGPYQVRWR